MQMSCTCTVAYVRVKSTASKKLVLFKLQYKMWQRRFYFLLPIYLKKKKKRSRVVTAFTVYSSVFLLCDLYVCALLPVHSGK